MSYLFRTAPGLQKTHSCSLLYLGVILDVSLETIMIGEVVNLAFIAGRRYLVLESE